MALFVDENVFGLEVSVQNVHVVQELHGENHFGDEELGLVLLKDLAFLEVDAEVASRAVVENHVQVLWSLETVVHLDDVGVVGPLEHVGLRDRVL